MSTTNDDVASSRTPVDDLDIALIEQLELDGRASFVDLGRAVGLSGESARQRYNRLVESGLVSVLGVVNPARAGLTTVAGLHMTVFRRLDDVTTALQQLREITFIAWTAGDFNVTCEVACESREALMRIAYDIVPSLDGVHDVRVQEFLHVYKFETGIRIAPLRPAELGPHGGSRQDSEALDPLNRELVRLLREDGRIPFTELAQRLGQPYGIVRRRCQSLLGAGVVQIAVVVDRLALQRSVMGMVMLHIRGDVRAAVQQLANIDGVEILVRTSGLANWCAEIAGSSKQDVVRLVDEVISAIPGVECTLFQIYTAIKKLPSQWRFDER